MSASLVDTVFPAKVTTALFVVGGLFIMHYSARVAKWIFTTFFRPSHNLSKRYGGPNAWALVTGATDGIGKAAASELASRGFNVLLVSRSEEKLVAASQDILSAYPNVQVKTLAVDFSSFGAEERVRVEASVKSLGQNGLAILINNVGASYDFPQLFHELDDASVDTLTRLNVDSTNFMTRIALRSMLDRKVGSGQRKGAIMNVGSVAGLFSNPGLAGYSAAKANVEFLSRGLAYEYESLGIDVQCTTPAFIVSKLSKFRKATNFVPSPETFAKELCNHIGYEAVVNPHHLHGAFAAVMKTLPDPLVGKFVKSHHMGIRAKALKKKTSDAAAKKVA